MRPTSGRCRCCDRRVEHVLAAAVAMKTLDQARAWFIELKTKFRINPWDRSDLLCGFCDRFFRYFEEDRRAREQQAA